MIEVKNISKSFDDKNILHDINATFYTGKTNLIIGQSGSGKTVLMKSIVGLIRPESGEILYDGRVLSENDNIADEISAKRDRDAFSGVGIV